MIAARVSITRGATMGHMAQQDRREEEMGTNVDVVNAAPTALLVLPNFPELPRVIALEDGDDLEEKVRQALGGEPDSTEKVTDSDREIGVIAAYDRAGVKVSVHAGPDSLTRLQNAVDDLKKTVAMKTRGVIVIQGPPGVCICGKCPEAKAN